MLRKLFTAAIIVTGTSAALLSTGCATNGDKPYGLTGDADRPALQKELAERQRWTDDKGRYHAEWRAGLGTPPGYPKGRPTGG